MYNITFFTSYGFLFCLNLYWRKWYFIKYIYIYDLIFWLFKLINLTFCGEKNELTNKIFINYYELSINTFRQIKFYTFLYVSLKFLEFLVLIISFYFFPCIPVRSTGIRLVNDSTKGLRGIHFPPFFFFFFLILWKESFIYLFIYFRDIYKFNFF